MITGRTHTKANAWHGDSRTGHELRGQANSGNETGGRGLSLPPQCFSFLDYLDCTRALISLMVKLGNKREAIRNLEGSKPAEVIRTNAMKFLPNYFRFLSRLTTVCARQPSISDYAQERTAGKNVLLLPGSTFQAQLGYIVS